MAKKATMDDLVDIKNCYLQSDYEFRPSSRNSLEIFLARHIREGHCYWDYGVSTMVVKVVEGEEHPFAPDANVGDLMFISTINGTNDPANLDKLMDDIYDEYSGNVVCWGKTKKTNAKMIARFNKRTELMQTKEMGDYILYWWKIEDIIK